MFFFIRITGDFGPHLVAEGLLRVTVSDQTSGVVKRDLHLGDQKVAWKLVCSITNLSPYRPSCFIWMNGKISLSCHLQIVRIVISGSGIRKTTLRKELCQWLQHQNFTILVGNWPSERKTWMFKKGIRTKWSYHMCFGKLLQITPAPKKNTTTYFFPYNHGSWKSVGPKDLLFPLQ